MASDQSLAWPPTKAAPDMLSINLTKGTKQQEQVAERTTSDQQLYIRNTASDQQFYIENSASDQK